MVDKSKKEEIKRDFERKFGEDEDDLEMVQMNKTVQRTSSRKSEEVRENLENATGTKDLSSS